MRAVLHTLGTAGDVGPFIAMARLLRQRGHQVLFVLNPAHADQVCDAGFDVRQAGQRWAIEELDAHPEYLGLNGPIEIFKQIYLPNVAPIFRELETIFAEGGADVLVAHFMCHGALWAARKQAVPCAAVTLAPCWWYSRAQPSVYGAWVPPAWLHGFLTGPFLRFVQALTGPLLRPLTAELGVPFRRDIFMSSAAEASLNLGLWSSSFCGPASDDGPGYRICGFPHQEAAPLPTRVQRFIDAGEPPVVVGLGTSAVHYAQGLYRRLALACRELGQRVVLVGASADQAAGLDATALAVDRAPFETLFARASTVVHHGGIGTCAAALRAGRPMVVVPFVADQFDNALRLRRMGLSRTLYRPSLSVPACADLLEDVLGDATLGASASASGRALRAERDGLLRAVEHIEDLA